MLSIYAVSDTDQLVEMMFGKQISLSNPQPAYQDKVVFGLDDLVVEKYPLKIGPVNFQLRAGEVIGLAGMEGSGQDLLLRACVGLIKPIAGRVVVNGKELTNKNYLEFKDNGVSYLPASRLEEGLVPGLSLAEHFTVTSGENRKLFIDKAYFQQQAEKMIEEYRIVGRPDTLVETLSGGNQQRAALSLLQESLSIILLEHPTRGLDMESAIYMWDKLKERCAQGASIFFISADLEEILLYSDRILVFFSGQVSPPLDAAGTSLEQLGHLIGGKGWNFEVVSEDNDESKASS